MSNEIIVMEEAGYLSPVVSVEKALLAHQNKKLLIDGIMKPNVDFGIIPGTSKNTLLKAGAEKATSFFGLSPRFRDAVAIEDFTGKDHDGEPFFFYRRTCELWRSDHIVASVDGSCNSFEKKYRWRNADRICPVCGKPAIIKGREEYGGGWICFKKKDGCGEKFGDADQRITEQQTGQVKNPDVADLANTILKMADKRALVAATLIATGLSEYFTQDIEDFITGEITPEPLNMRPGKIPSAQELAGEENQDVPNDQLPNSDKELRGLYVKEATAALLVLPKGTKLPSITAKSTIKEIQESIAGIRAMAASQQ